MSERLVGHVFGRWGPRGPFRVYSWTQAAVTAVGVTAAALLMVAGATGPAVVLVGVLGALGLRDATGLPAWTRVGLGLRHLSGRRRRTSDLEGWPVEVAGCVLAAGVMGVVADRGRFLAAMRVSPTADPWLRSPEDREVAADDWARVVSSIPLETIDRLQVLTVTRRGGREGLVADAAGASGPGLEVVKEAAVELAGAIRTTDTVLVVRLSQPASREAARRGGVEAAGRMLYGALQHLGGQFPPSELTAEILAPADWTGLLAGLLDGGAGVEERWDRVRAGGRWHQLLWMWQWPQRPVTAGFLAPLLTGGERVVSLLIEPADPEAHQRSLDWAYRRAATAAATATGGRHRKQATLEALDTQLRELNQGHIPVRALVAVAVSGPDAETVAEAAGRVRSDAVAGSCRVAVAAGRQRQALAVTLPLCRGLDKGVDW